MSRSLAIAGLLLATLASAGCGASADQVPHETSPACQTRHDQCKSACRKEPDSGSRARCMTGCLEQLRDCR